MWRGEGNPPFHPSEQARRGPRPLPMKPERMGHPAWCLVGWVLTGGVKLGGCDNFAVDGSERGGDDL